MLLCYFRDFVLVIFLKIISRFFELIEIVHFTSEIFPSLVILKVLYTAGFDCCFYYFLIGEIFFEPFLSTEVTLATFNFGPVENDLNGSVVKKVLSDRGMLYTFCVFYQVRR